MMFWLHFLLYTTERNHVLIRSNTLCFNYLNNVNLDKHHSLPCSILCAEKGDNCHFLHSLNNAFSVECLECPLFFILVLWSLILEHITQSINHKKWYCSIWRILKCFDTLLYSHLKQWSIKTSLLHYIQYGHLWLLS